MPELCRFYGIVLKMFFDVHNPPLFHAEYGSHEVTINIKTLGVLTGKLPPRALGLVMEWASLHRDELEAAWSKAKCKEAPGKMEPLS